MEAFNCLIDRAAEGGFFLGCSISERMGERLVISHLLYADDTFLFCGLDGLFKLVDDVV